MSRWWRDVKEALGDRHFWALFGWSLLALCAFGYLFWLAIKVAKNFSLVDPILCGASQTEWRVLGLILVGPFFAVSVLSAIGELWNVLSLRRRGRRVRFTGFAGYAALTFVLGNALLLALSC